VTFQLGCAHSKDDIKGGLQEASMNTEFNIRHIEAPRQLTNPQVPAEGGDPKDVNAILQNREERATTLSGWFQARPVYYER